MQDRREFLRGVFAASTGAYCVGCGLRHARAQSAPKPRREVSIAGQRVQTIDIHSHILIRETLDVVKGTPLEPILAGQFASASQAIPVGDQRLGQMNGDGIDMQALSINAYWYDADRDLSRRLIDVQNQKLSEICKAYPDRFTAFASVALQFPDLAAEQMEHAIKDLGLRGVAIGGSLGDDELSARKFDPFWAKAEEMQALVFIHPQPDGKSLRVRTGGSGALNTVLGNPWETTIALAHLIFEGTLDRFPRLKICAAHGGGFLPSYAARMDHGCFVFPKQCTVKLQKRPTEYLNDLYYDTLVFTPEGLRHLVAQCGASQFMVGTDYPISWMQGPDGWTVGPVDQVLQTPDLTDADRIAILHGTAAKLLHMGA
ncbi:MAG TPA: amidohydrolase family protein [Beijerinckiaceae bacterium]|nr:amidohydrolase family protein [Beijerinckiaceae bacterium]